MTHKKCSGFTFIELIITLMIIGLLTGMAGISIYSWLPKYYLKAAARDVKSNMLLCRMRAVKDNANCEFSFVSSGNAQYTMSGLSGGTPYSQSVNLTNDYRGYVTYGRAGHGMDTDYDKGTDNGSGSNTFTSNKAVFQPSGRPAGAGGVYLQSTKGGDAYAISMNVAGSVTIRKWDSSQGKWVSL
jgi:prepilin-type N-terminal cleavage/methylation domain-containing protein